MNKKIGIFSITLDRLYYTYHCLKALKDKAGISYEHIIVDNGSTDGTYEWLKEEGFQVIRNNENRGITGATKQAYDWFKSRHIDIVIKVDPDCEILTPDTISKIAEVFTDDLKKLIVSPVVKGIDTVPEIVKTKKVASFEFNETQHIGGIFRAMKFEDFTELVSKCKVLNDKTLNEYFRQNGFQVGYLPTFEVKHFETTKGQEKRYPRYFSKKYIY